MPVSQLVASILESDVNSAKSVLEKNKFTQQQLEEFIQEASGGNMVAQFIVGYMYFNGIGITQDKTKSFEFYSLAANQGHMVAQFSVGCHFEVEKDFEKAFQYYLLSANQGYARAQYNTGNCYRNKMGVSQDYQKAIEYYQKAIAQGNTKAKVGLGRLYHKGKEVQDYKKAMEYYLQAAQEGNALACYNIGELYERGHGVSKDRRKAVEYYQMATTKEKFPAAEENIKKLKAERLKTAENWTVDDVIEWITELKLSKSYRELIQENNVNGEVLFSMKTKEDWRELGVTSFGDIRILVNTPIPGRDIVPPTPVAASATSITTVVTRPNTNGRFVRNEGLDDVVYKPVINLMEGDFKPPHSCNKHMLDDLPNILLAVRNVAAIVKECVLVAESRLQHLPSHVPPLSTDEALAIAAYSYDLGVVDTEVNLYHALNAILRKRDPKKMERLKPFLFYLMSGLSKLPPLQTTVYRGIPFSSMQMIRDNYRLGLSVHWSGFTSASTDIKSAKEFAQESGIIFRIKVLTGRSIKHYSSIPSEDEVLLSPNIKLLVTSGVEKETDGFFYLDLVEQLQGPAFIF